MVFYKYRLPIQQINKKMRQYEEAGEETSALYDRLRTQLLVITRERNNLFESCTEEAADVVLATMMELPKHREFMRKLERWEGLNQGGPFEPTALSEDDRKDKRLVVCADHYTDLLRDNDKQMDVLSDEAEGQRDLLMFAAEERAKLIEEREANIVQLRLQHKAEVKTSVRQTQPGSEI